MNAEVNIRDAPGRESTKQEGPLAVRPLESLFIDFFSCLLDLLIFYCCSFHNIIRTDSAVAGSVNV